MGEYGVLAEYLPFALPGVKKHRLFEDILARSSCALDRQGANGPPTVPGRTHRPPGAASCHFHVSSKLLIL